MRNYNTTKWDSIGIINIKRINNAFTKQDREFLQNNTIIFGLRVSFT